MLRGLEKGLHCVRGSRPGAETGFAFGRSNRAVGRTHPMAMLPKRLDVGARGVRPIQYSYLFHILGA